MAYKIFAKTWTKVFRISRTLPALYQKISVLTRYLTRPYCHLKLLLLISQKNTNTFYYKMYHTTSNILIFDKFLNWYLVKHWFFLWDRSITVIILGQITSLTYDLWFWIIVLLLSFEPDVTYNFYILLQLITRQFVPMTGTFIFNGVDHKSQLLSL